MNKIEIKQIGNGTAFDEQGTSFLIDTKNQDHQVILFDASPGSFKFLLENNSENPEYLCSNYLEYNNLYIYISHTHLDHIADLEKIIYYRYYKLNGLGTQLIVHPDIYQELQFLLKKLLINFENNKVNKLKVETIYKIEEFSIEKYNYVLIYQLKENYNLKELKYSNLIKNLNFEIFKTEHIVCPSYGMIFKNNNNLYIFTGDTKANFKIKNLLNKYLSISSFIDKIYVYHDFSKFNDPFNNIHACQKDIEYYYDKEILEHEKIKFIKVHNG